MSSYTSASAAVAGSMASAIGNTITFDKHHNVSKLVYTFVKCNCVYTHKLLHINYY